LKILSTSEIMKYRDRLYQRRIQEIVEISQLEGQIHNFKGLMRTCIIKDQLVTLDHRIITTSISFMDNNILIVQSSTIIPTRVS
jgi:hypothetical protein